jgi:integrase
MSEDKKSPGRYGDGGVYLRGRIWWICYREVNPLASGEKRHVQHCESTGSEDRKFAQRLLRSRLMAQGGRRRTVTEPGSVRYEDLRENLLAFYLANARRSLKKSADGSLTLNTLPRLDRFFGGWKAKDIAVSHLNRFRAQGRKEGASDARMNRHMATLRKMFKQALKDELITGAEMPSYFPVTAERNIARGAVFIEPKWYPQLRKLLREPLRSAFTLAYHSGIRVGELEKLRWRDFDFVAHCVRLPAEITKTGYPRIVPLPSGFDRAPGAPDELAFSLGDCRERWRGACVKVGAGWYECRECGARCSGKKCPSHGELLVRKLRYRGLLLRHCRHTAVRNMSDAGIREARIMAVTGHVTRSTFDRYNIGREKDVATVREAMERFHVASQGG